MPFPPVLLSAPPDPPAAAEPASSGWLEGEHATGEWGGARTALERHGLTIDLSYTGEFFANVHGGLTTSGARDYRGEVDLGLTLDTEKLGAWPGGRLYVLAQNGHGHGITERYVGAGQTVSNLEADPFTQLSEFWYEHTLFDGLMILKLGKLDANRDFGTPRYGGNFINGSFGAPPTVPMPSFPAPGLGGVILVQPAKFLVLRTAMYEGSPAVESFGFDSAFEPGAGVFTIASVGVTHTFGADARHGGTSSLGVWHHNGLFPPTTRDPDVKDLTGNGGVFFIHDERIYENPKDKDNTEGLHLFFRFAWAPPDRNNTDRYIGAGVAYHGIPGRDNDTVGVGMGTLHFVQPLRGATTDGTELFVEAFYKARFTHWISLEPDFQFFRHPGGDGRNAVVLGTRAKLKL